MLRGLNLLIAVVALSACHSGSGQRAMSHQQCVTSDRRAEGTPQPDTVRIKYDVMADGRVDNIDILESATTPEIQTMLINQLRTWRFARNNPQRDCMTVVRIHHSGAK